MSRFKSVRVLGCAAVLLGFVACGAFGASDGGESATDAGQEAEVAPGDGSGSLDAGDAAADGNGDAGPVCEAKHVACTKDCGVVTLSTYGGPPIDDALHLALGPTDVFFSLNVSGSGLGSLYRVRKDNSQGAADLIADGVPGIGPVAVGAGWVYFTGFNAADNKTSVYRIDSSSGPCTAPCTPLTPFASGTTAFNDRPASTLSVVKDAVFVGSSNGVAVRVALTGATQSFGSVGSVSVVADPLWLYFGGTKDDKVQRVHHDGKFLETLATGVVSFTDGGAFPGPLGLAANCRTVFATELEARARIFAIATDKTPPVTPDPLYTIATGGGLIAADSDFVYFTRPAATYYVDVYRVSMAGALDTVFLSTTLAEPMRGLVDDDSYLYWVNNNGAVRRKAK